LPIEDFAKGEEILFAYLLGKLADPVVKEPRQIALQVPKSVDAKSIYIKAGDDILIGANKNVF